MKYLDQCEFCNKAISLPECPQFCKYMKMCCTSCFEKLDVRCRVIYKLIKDSYPQPCPNCPKIIDDEDNIISETISCRMCDGTGIIDCYLGYRSKKNKNKGNKCIYCDGKGEITYSYKKPSGV